MRRTWTLLGSGLVLSLMAGCSSDAGPGHAGANAERGPYGEGSFARPYLPGEEPEPAGGDGGMGSRTQADVTPGAEPTKKPEGGA